MPIFLSIIFDKSQFIFPYNFSYVLIVNFWAPPLDLTLRRYQFCIVVEFLLFTGNIALKTYLRVHRYVLIWKQMILPALLVTLRKLKSYMALHGTSVVYNAMSDLSPGNICYQHVLSSKQLKRLQLLKIFFNLSFLLTFIMNFCCVVDTIFF